MNNEKRLQIESKFPIEIMTLDELTKLNVGGLQAPPSHLHQNLYK